MSSFKRFAEWLEEKKATNEMTASGAATGGMTSTADIAGFARPLQFHAYQIRQEQESHQVPLRHPKPSLD
jgi:hypothetical protein